MKNFVCLQCILAHSVLVHLPPYSQHDLHLGLDHQRVCHREAVQHLGQLHELLPAPVVLTLAKAMERVCTVIGGI